jgi:hypothetical protein
MDNANEPDLAAPGSEPFAHARKELAQLKLV